MPGDAVRVHDSMVEASVIQRRRLGQQAEEDRWTGALAERFRSNPHREPEGLLRAFLELIRPEDVVLDVGGGGGRFSLAMALHCHEVINIDPSAGMHAVFDSVAAEFGITNARYIEQDWLTSEGFAGDVSIVSHVTYFVKDLETFVRKLEAATRRLVVIDVTATPNPNRGADVFRATWGESQALVPGYKELLPALWDIGILPEIRVLPEGSFQAPGPPARLFSSQSDAVAALVGSTVPGQGDRERQANGVREHFDELFETVEGGFRQRYRPDQRQVLVLWSPGLPTPIL